MKRFKLLIVAAAIVLVAVLGISSASSAQEEPTTTSEKVEVPHASEECIHILEDGGTIDDCQAAPTNSTTAVAGARNHDRNRIGEFYAENVNAE